MEPESVVSYDYPREPYSEVIPGLVQASAAHSPAEMLSMFDFLVDVVGSTANFTATGPRR